MIKSPCIKLYEIKNYNMMAINYGKNLTSKISHDELLPKKTVYLVYICICGSNKITYFIALSRRIFDYLIFSQYLFLRKQQKWHLTSIASVTKQHISASASSFLFSSVQSSSADLASSHSCEQNMWKSSMIFIGRFLTLMFSKSDSSRDIC